MTVLDFNSLIYKQIRIQTTQNLIDLNSEGLATCHRWHQLSTTSCITQNVKLCKTRRLKIIPIPENFADKLIALRTIVFFTSQLISVHVLRCDNLRLQFSCLCIAFCMEQVIWSTSDKKGACNDKCSIQFYSTVRLRISICKQEKREKE